MLKLETNKRDPKISAESVRESGFIPAVVYGPKQEAVSVSIKQGDFTKILRDAGESTIVTLIVDGENIDVLIHEIQYHPVKGDVTHVDFYAVEKGKKLQVTVKLEFVGVSPAEKVLGGILVKVIHEVEIESLPKDLPSHLEVSLESLVDFDSQIHASDIVLPAGVTLITEADEVVALVKEAKEEVVEEVATPDLSKIEVEKKGKKEEETVTTE